nr:TPA_asm: hypothetical protein [Unuamitovirus sp. 'pemphredoni']
MSKRAFTYDDTTYKYSVGQPMGLYSSWAIFALSHHIAVRISAKRALLGIRWCKYALLGDDIVLSNPKVAYEYRKLMNEMGVDISDSKTHESNDTCEFAKRWYRNGLEFSGVQLNSILTVRGNWTLLCNEFEALCNRFGETPHDKARGVLLEFMDICTVPKGRYKYAKNYLMLPRLSDISWIKSEKVRHLARVHFETISCNWRVGTLERLVIMLLAEVKASVIMTGIVENSKKMNVFSRRLLTTLPLGLDPTSTLLKLPFFRVVKQISLKLQDTVDKLKKGYVDLDPGLVYGDILIPSVDPERIISRRVVSELILTRSNLIQKCKRHMADVRKTQEHIMKEDNSIPPLRVRE